MTFTATAYCDRGITKSGTRTREGIIAADLDLLPLGSVVRISAAGDKRYERTYTVMDTGRHIKGRRIDLYVNDCSEARRFGVRHVRLEVVRVGKKSSQLCCPSPSPLEHMEVGARDAIHVAVMLNNDVTTIASFDAGFDRGDRPARAVNTLSWNGRTLLSFVRRWPRADR